MITMILRTETIKVHHENLVNHGSDNWLAGSNKKPGGSAAI
jgi:hypothetical protein